MKKGLVFLLLPPALLLGCASAEERLLPPPSTQELRIDDLERMAAESPVEALYLTAVYEERYGPGAESAAVRTGAIARLKERQIAAIAEDRWIDAVSLARSLAALGIVEKDLPDEAELYLRHARSLAAADQTLASFLAAQRADRLRPLSGADAAAFLERAVAAGQRRTAACFLRSAQAAGVATDPALRTFAEIPDSAAQMIKGVATVWVDRGIKIEKGRGLPDRVIGSAFFVDASGLAVTNYHVIASEVDPEYEGYSRLFIRLGDAASPRIPAKVVGWDQALDLAVIKAEIEPEYVFSILDGAVPRVGESVYAIGSPAGLEKTVTSGIVSALGRRFLQIGDVIQIDAAVNHGNSGGPVVDAAGRLVGVVFAGIEQFEGLNFAVPAARLTAALPRMLQGGKAERPWLGLSLGETRDGLEVVYVAPFTPADEARLEQGAVIAAINGQSLTAPQGSRIPEAQDLLFPGRPGELVTLQTADGRTRLLMTAVRPALPLAQAAKNDSRERMAAPLFGLILAPSAAGIINPAYLVRKVVRGSVADEAGLSENDPVSLRGFRVDEDNGVAYLELNVKKRRMGYLETTMRLPALLDTPDTL